MVQVARRSASVLKRRKSRNRMEAPDRNQEGAVGSNTNDVVTPNTPGTENHDSEVMYYMDEPQTGKPNNNEPCLILLIFLNMRQH